MVVVLEVALGHSLESLRTDIQAEHILAFRLVIDILGVVFGRDQELPQVLQ
jgi:hypothetical protein